MSLLLSWNHRFRFFYFYASSATTRECFLQTGTFAARSSPNINNCLRASNDEENAYMRDARLLLPSSLLISAFNIDKMENTLNAYEIFIMCVNKWYKFFSSVILKDNFHVGILEILRGHTKLITNTNFIPPFPFVYNLRNLQQKPDLYNILEGKNARAFFWPNWFVWFKSSKCSEFWLFSKCRFARFPLIGSRLLLSGTKYLTLKWRACGPHTHSHNRIVFADALRLNQIAMKKCTNWANCQITCCPLLKRMFFQLCTKSDFLNPHKSLGKYEIGALAPAQVGTMQPAALERRTICLHSLSFFRLPKNSMDESRWWSCLAPQNVSTHANYLIRSIIELSSNVQCFAARRHVSFLLYNPFIQFEVNAIII